MYSTPGNLPQQLLHRLGDALFHFTRRCARHLHEDVHHRHDDLRLFLARQLPHREGAQQQASRRSPAASASSRSRAWANFPAGPSVRSRFTAGPPPWRRRRDPGGTGKITFSPAVRPESTSTRSLTFCPAVISRVWATPLSATSTDCNWPRSRDGAPPESPAPSGFPAGMPRARRRPSEAPAAPGRSILTSVGARGGIHRGHDLGDPRVDACDRRCPE